jgi:hypothetical protein
MVKVSGGYNVMVCLALSAHVPLAPITVYTIGLVVGVAVTLAPVEALRPVDGDQV